VPFMIDPKEEQYKVSVHPLRSIISQINPKEQNSSKTKLNDANLNEQIQDGFIHSQAAQGKKYHLTSVLCVHHDNTTQTTIDTIHGHEVNQHKGEEEKPLPTRRPRQNGHYNNTRYHR